MRSLLFIIRRTLKNIVKGVFKKPILLIGYLFIAFFIVSMVLLPLQCPQV